MTDTQLTLKRLEKKYLLSAEQYARLWPELEAHLKPDVYFESVVRSIYYDSDSYDLIRSSISKPVYKEKLRLRSYGGAEGAVFVEVKKKFKGTVYKRRIQMGAGDAAAWLDEGRAPGDGQVVREINWLLQSRGPLKPKVFIVCDRRAYTARDNEELRITFDRSVRWRGTDLSFSAGDWGEELLKGGQILMEIKLPGAAPLWLAHLLSGCGVFPTGFSKYGVCYAENLLGELALPREEILATL